MVYNYFRSDRFKKEYQKLDRRQQELVDKKIQKIVKAPLSGKPLHAPLQNYRSERIEKLSIIYALVGKTIKFTWLDDRGHVY